MSDKPDQMIFVKINVSDIDAAEAFYTEALGMKRQREVTDPAVTERMMTSPGGSFTLVLFHWTKPRDLDQGNAWGPIGYAVEDLDGAIARIEKAGGSVKRGPFEFGGAKLIFMASPDGHEIELIQRG